MANLKAIRTRITSVQSTKKITKAMNMVAASKLRKTEAQLMSLRPYADTLITLVEKLGHHLETDHPFFKKRDSERRLYVFVSGDKGLCGSFNSNIARKAREIFSREPRAYAVAVGKKICDALRHAGIETVRSYADILSSPSYHSAKEISDLVSEFYLQHEDVGEVIFVFNRFKNSIVSFLDQENFLPREKTLDETRRVFITEPGQHAMLEAAMKEYLESEVYRIMLESLSSEFGARMNAMEAATDNAEDMINQLVMKANRERQSIITTELTEIVNGANAL